MSKVVSWAIQVEFENGETELCADVPDDVAQIVDDWITQEVENGTR